MGCEGGEAMTRGQLLNLLGSFLMIRDTCDQNICGGCGADQQERGERNMLPHEPGCELLTAYNELLDAGHLDAEIANLRIYDSAENDE